MRYQTDILTCKACCVSFGTSRSAAGAGTAATLWARLCIASRICLRARHPELVDGLDSKASRALKIEGSGELVDRLPRVTDCLQKRLGRLLLIAMNWPAWGNAIVECRPLVVLLAHPLSGGLLSLRYIKFT